MVRFATGIPAAHQLRSEMDRLVSSLFAESAGTISTKMASPVGFPPLNLWEEDSSYFAEAELPGVKSEDLDMSVLGRDVVIKGSRSFDTEEEKATKWISRERGEGRFERHIRLPHEVDAEQIEAHLADGVLKLTLPKAQSALPRQIKVNQSIESK